MTRVAPCDGGCWFCYTQDDSLLFDTEFDTYVHEKCIREALKRDPEHPEAQCMTYLLDSEYI